MQMILIGELVLKNKKEKIMKNLKTKLTIIGISLLS